VDDDSDDELEEFDEDPQASPQLRDAAERLLAREHARGRTRRPSRWTTDQDRLTRVLELLGQLNNERLEAGGMFTMSEPEPRDEDERRDQALRERQFVRHCAEALAAVAAAALEFAIELAASLEDHKPRGRARTDAIDDLRSELFDELAAHTAGPGVPPLAPRKRDVAEHLGLIVLPAVALDAADAAYELAQGVFPGQATSTATYMAAKLLAAGEELAIAADYPDWPAIDDE
jgi:hypothetical protein